MGEIGDLSPIEKIGEIVKGDPRYAVEAYLFVFRALDGTLKKLGIHRHVTGQELLGGIKELAIEEFGFMARTVFHKWGIRRTEDFGEIVFNLVDSGLMGKTDRDSKDDFKNGYDFTEVFERNLKLDLQMDRRQGAGKSAYKGQ